jgi:transposase
MIQREEFFMIRDLKSKGWSIARIAKELSLDRKTVKKWLVNDELPHYHRKKQSSSKLEPFKSYILERMNEGCLNASVLFDELLAKGYKGKRTILRSFMKPHRETAERNASQRFETPPGRQAQVDWGHFKLQTPDGKTKKVHAFVMIMGHSRRQYVEFTEDEKLDTLIGCHERAFTFFGGVPETILYDNMKTVVRYSHRTDETKWNEQFWRFANHHRFRPQRCRPYRAKTKGKVENGVKYVRRNFWPRLSVISSLAMLNEQVQLWLDTVCNVRLHQTTREIPNEAFLRENLKPFNPSPFQLVEYQSRKVMNDCCICYETNVYSVPHRYVGRRVKVRDLKNGMFEIYDENGNRIATHCKSDQRYQRIQKKKHFEGLHIGGQMKVATTAPILSPTQTPKVYQRPLQVYDAFTSEVSV